MGLFFFFSFLKLRWGRVCLRLFRTLVLESGLELVFEERGLRKKEDFLGCFFLLRFDRWRG